MNIVMNLPEPKEVRADSLKEGEAFMEGGFVYVIISSNPCHLKVRTTRRGFLPAVLVDNLSTSSLGWLNRDAMVVAVELELIVTESQKN